MKQYLLDTSVVLDLLLNRLPWAADAAVIWDAHRNHQIRAWIAASTVPTIYYITRKQAGLPAAQTAVHACLTTLDIVPTDSASLLAAHALAGPDFEDDLQIACAVQAGVDAIVTRDPNGFAAQPDPGGHAGRPGHFPVRAADAVDGTRQARAGVPCRPARGGRGTVRPPKQIHGRAGRPTVRYR